MIPRDLRWVKEFALGRGVAPLSTLFFGYILRVSNFPRIKILVSSDRLYTCKVEIQPSRKKFKRVDDKNKYKIVDLQLKCNKYILVSVEFMIPRDLRWVKEFALGRGVAPLSTLFFGYILRVSNFPRIKILVSSDRLYTCKVEIQPSRKKLTRELPWHTKNKSKLRS